MSHENHYLEYIGPNPKNLSGSSYKFWEIDRRGTTVVTRFGAIGTQGQKQSKVFGTEHLAQRHVSDKLSEKLGKGYVDAKHTPAFEQPGALPVSEADMAAARARLQKVEASLTEEPS